jgi:hypothetical protein
MDNIDEAGSFKLKVPADAAQKGLGDGASFSWSEPLRVVDASCKPDEKEPTRDLIVIQFKIPAEQLDSENAGRNYPQWYRVNVDAIGDKNHDDHLMSTIACARLRSLAVAAGFEVEEGTDLFSFFTPQGPGEQAPIVGAEITAKVQDKPGKTKDGEAIRRQEPVAFFAGI